MKIQRRRIWFPVTRTLSAIFYHHGVTENTLTLRQNLDKVMKEWVRERESERERERESERGTKNANIEAKQSNSSFISLRCTSKSWRRRVDSNDIVSCKASRVLGTLDLFSGSVGGSSTAAAATPLMLLLQQKKIPTDLFVFVPLFPKLLLLLFSRNLLSVAVIFCW